MLVLLIAYAGNFAASFLVRLPVLAALLHLPFAKACIRTTFVAVAIQREWFPADGTVGVGIHNIEVRGFWLLSARGAAYIPYSPLEMRTA